MPNYNITIKNAVQALQDNKTGKLNICLDVAGYIVKHDLEVKAELEKVFERFDFDVSFKDAEMNIGACVQMVKHFGSVAKTSKAIDNYNTAQVKEGNKPSFGARTLVGKLLPKGESSKGGPKGWKANKRLVAAVDAGIITTVQAEQIAALKV